LTATGNRKQLQPSRSQKTKQHQAKKYTQPDRRRMRAKPKHTQQQQQQQQQHYKAIDGHEAGMRRTPRSI
jgi:hypothetical protein